MLSSQFESLGDVRPTETRIAEADDSLRVTFIWPLAPWEALLVESGQQHRLERFRAEFLKAIAPSLAEVVELATGREAPSPRSELGPGGRLATVRFALGAPTEDRVESREAIRNWGSQVRRNARRLRADHRKQVAALRRTVRAVEDTKRQVRSGSD
jgi:hypothetical protein